MILRQRTDHDKMNMQYNSREWQVIHGNLRKPLSVKDFKGIADCYCTRVKFVLKWNPGTGHDNL
jgi:hypothetical protein